MNNCPITKEFEFMIDHCRPDYSLEYADTKSYGPGWKTNINPNINPTNEYFQSESLQEYAWALSEADLQSPWQYASELANIPYTASTKSYPPGGFMLQLKRSVGASGALLGGRRRH